MIRAKWQDNQWFGYARVRRVERQLIREYRALIALLLPDLNADNYELAVRIAELPDVVRGYEGIKLASVAEFRQKVEDLRRRFRAVESAAQTV